MLRKWDSATVSQLDFPRESDPNFLREEPQCDNVVVKKKKKKKTTPYVHAISKCFKPSQPQRIILGLKENFTKRYIVERTNKAEIRPKEQSEKAESC